MLSRFVVSFLSLFATTSLFAALSGTVMTSDGVPVAGARVSLRTFESEEARRLRLLSENPTIIPVASTQTDAKGSFSLNAPAEAIVALTIERKGYVPLQTWIERDESLGAFILSPAEVRSGSVTAAGRPVANATVSILYGGFEYITRTDESGRYEAPDLKGARRLSVVHPDYAIDDTTFTLPAGGRASDVHRKLIAGTSFRGRVVGPSGDAPIAGATIEVDGWPLAKSGEDGAFTIARLPQTWSFIIARKDAMAGQRTYSKNAASTIRLERAATVAGRVKDSKTKTAIAGAIVRLLRRSISAEVASTVVTDAKGNYAFSMPAGSWNVSAMHPAYSPDHLSVASISGRADTGDLSLEPLARISGSVVDESRQPVAAAVVTPADVDDFRGAPPVRATARAFTGPDGRFVLRAEAGDQAMWVEAKKRGFPSGRSDSFTLAPGERKSGIAITIPRGIEVTGLVTNTSGTPLSGVGVNADQAQQGPRGMMMMGPGPQRDDDPVVTASDGTFTLRLAEGTWDFTFRRDGYASKVVRGQTVTESQPTRIETSLEPGAAISGRVTREGAGVEGVAIHAFGTDSSANTAADGSFEISGLASGSTRLMIRKETEYINEMKVVDAPASGLVIEVPGGGGVSGRVVDKATNNPITTFQAGVSQSINLGGMIRTLPPRMLDFTSDDGTFEIDNVPIGGRVLFVSAPGYAPARLNVTIEEGKSADAGDVQLATGVKLTGRVTGPSGGPLADVSVRPMPSAVGGVGPASISATTDEQGAYTLEGLNAGEETIQFSHDRYVTARKRVTLKGAEARLDAQLGAGHKISGSVVTEGGAPVSEAVVEALSADGAYESSRTNASGMFEIASAAPGRYRFTAIKSGFAKGTVADVDVSSGAPVRITLSNGGTIYGRVTGLSERDLARVTVNASRGSDQSSASVDAAGNYRLEGAPIGSVEVVAGFGNMEEHRTSNRQRIEVTAGGSHQVDLSFGEGNRVSGRVTRNGTPVGQAAVSFISRQGGSNAAGTTDEEGFYAVAGLDAGDYAVNVRQMTRNVNYSTQYTVHGPATFDISFSSAAVRGRVIDASTNDPLSNASVQLRSNAPASGAVPWGGTYGGITDAGGAFVIDGVPQNSYVLTASRDGYGNETRDVTVGSSAVDGLEIKLMRNDGVVLKAVDARDGRSIRATAMVFDAQGRLVYEARAFFATGDASESRLPLAPGTYSAYVWSIGYAGRNVTFQSPSTQTIPLTPGGTVLVQSRHGEPLRVRLLDASGTPMWRFGAGAPHRPIAPSPATTTLENIAPGTYTLQVLDRNDSVVDAKQVTVQEGQITTVEI